MRLFRNSKRKTMNEEKNINIEGESQEEKNEAQAAETQAQETENTQETLEQETSEKAQEEETKDPLDTALDEIAKLKDQLLRTVAEFENYKKRTLKEKAELILNGGEKTITAILPVLDD